MIKIAADPELNRGSFQRVRKGCFEPIAAVRLFAGRADVRFGDPLLTDPNFQSAHNRTVWQELVMILPILHADDRIEAVHDRSYIHVREGQSAIAPDGLRLELDFPGTE